MKLEDSFVEKLAKDGATEALAGMEDSLKSMEKMSKEDRAMVMLSFHIGSVLHMLENEGAPPEVGVKFLVTSAELLRLLNHMLEAHHDIWGECAADMLNVAQNTAMKYKAVLSSKQSKEVH